MNPMFHDLGLAESASGLTHRNRAAMAAKLGFSCVATTIVVSDRLTDAHRCNISSVDEASLAAADASLQPVAQLLPQRQPSGNAPAPSGAKQLRQLTRLTFKTAEAPMAAAALIPNSPITSTYDLLAVQPMSERLLTQACASLEVDIITLDLTARLGFPLRSGPLTAAVKRGLVFEILYAPAIRDETSRRHLFSNASALTRATRGKGIIISSGAREAFELRGAYDVINIGVLFGLSEQQAKASLSDTCAAVIAHARRRKACGGVVITERISQPIQGPPEQHQQQQTESLQSRSRAQLGKKRPLEM